MKLAALLLAALVLAGLPATGADAFSFDQAVPNQPLRGPAGAKAAIIWNHGKAADRDESNNPPPWLVNRLTGDGYDVFRLHRPLGQDNLKDSSQALDDSVERLWSQGYRRIVLGGQSYGAWISLMVAGHNRHVAAVIANAPAAYGTVERKGYERNATLLYDVLEQVRPIPVMLSFFDGDEYDPGGRAAQASLIFEGHRVPHLIIDRPSGFRGHGSGNSALFARRFGRCVEAVIAGNAPPTAASCAEPWGDGPTGDLPWPNDGPIIAGSAPFAGRWWGTCPNGRETLLAIERVTGRGDVDAAYGIGPTLDGNGPARVTRRHGRFEGDQLVFDEPGRPSLAYHRNPDGTLSSLWKTEETAPPSSLRCTLRAWTGS